MHLLLCAEDSEAELSSGLAESFPGAQAKAGRAGWLETDFHIPTGRRLPLLVFARQWLPMVRRVRAESVRGWANEVLGSIAGVLPDDRPWSLHVEPQYATRAVHHIGARAWHSQTLRSADYGMGNTGRGGGQGSDFRSKVQGFMRERRAAASGTSRTVDPRLAFRTGVGEPEQARGAVSSPDAGRHRCRLIREALRELMQRKRRHLLRQLRSEPGPFTANQALVQLLLTGPNEGFISVAAAPLPFEQRHLLSPFPKGEVPVASDPKAPSRAFAKLVEAELRLGRAIRAGESCVDLGASPGSWTYVALSRGAKVTAVDRSPLREDLLADPQLEFVPGDAFRFEPKQPVDWLVCDVLAAPERTTELLLQWLKRGWCRQFVVTLKLKDEPAADVLPRLKRELPPLTSEHFLMRLCANKKEVCVFGVREAEAGGQE